MSESPSPGSARRAKPQRHAVLLRLDPAVHAALARWADDELRSVNAQIEFLLKEAARSSGRLRSPADGKRRGPADPSR